MKKISTKEFIEKARKIHGDKYDYSKVEYINSHTKVCIICREHGEFWQAPYHHLNGSGCEKCAREYVASKNKKNITEFINSAKELYGDKYDYSKAEYKGNKIKVCIICREHGEFWQTPNHLLKGHGCPRCGIEYRASKRRTTLDEFIKKANEIHKNKYDYSKVNYKNSDVKVCIICREHGEFWQAPSSHLQGIGCPKCGYAKNALISKLSTKEFIERSRLVHGDKYDYSKVEYINSHTKVCIICREHGEFWQAPYSHLQSKGCPHCFTSSLEINTSKVLEKLNISNIRQQKFKWLGRQSLDFYLPDQNIAIECQGEQHYKPIDFFGGEEKLAYTKNLDEKKKTLCKEHGIKIHYIKYDENIENKVQEILNEYGIH